MKCKCMHMQAGGAQTHICGEADQAQSCIIISRNQTGKMVNTYAFRQRYKTSKAIKGGGELHI